jgi:hypothetical protein
MQILMETLNSRLALPPINTKDHPNRDYYQHCGWYRTLIWLATFSVMSFSIFILVINAWLGFPLIDTFLPIFSTQQIWDYFPIHSLLSWVLFILFSVEFEQLEGERLKPLRQLCRLFISVFCLLWSVTGGFLISDLLYPPILALYISIWLFIFLRHKWTSHTC